MNEPWAVTVRRDAPTVPPPRLPPILVPGSLMPVQLAAPWRRATAWVVDVLPFLVTGYALAVAVQGGRVRKALGPGLLTKSVGLKTLGLPDLSLTKSLDAAQLESLIGFTAAVLSVYVLWIGYRVVATALTGRSLGKWLVGIAVVDAADPRRNPSIAQAFRRCLVPQGAGLLPIPFTGFAPYLWLAKDARRQGLHDKAAGTLVVSRPR